MDRNDLLTAARASFLTGFTSYLDELIPLCEAVLFQHAGSALSLAEQSNLRDARAVLLNQNIALKRQLALAMEQLLNRSFQTAYSTFRPSFAGTTAFENLSLVDTSVLEDALHIDHLTKKLRDAVEDSLRDLNIRIALLFEQEDIKERENPFRPYLFVRAIVSSLENIQVSQDVMPVLAAQLVDTMTKQVSIIYENLNTLLADHGIAAQLHLKIRKSAPIMNTNLVQPVNDGYATAQEEAGGEDSRNQSRERIWSSPTREIRAGARVDQLLARVQTSILQGQAELGWGSTATPDLGPADVSINLTNQLPDPVGEIEAGGATEPVAKSWLMEAQALGDALRNFFAGAPADDQSSGLRGLAASSQTSTLIEAAQTLQSRVVPVSTAGMLSQDGSVRNLVMEHREALTALSNSQNEQMVIDVVAMLFEFILRDTQVPAEVRAQLGRLQFLVLKVALQDAALFAQKSHPARMLVNRIGSIVLDLQRLDPGGERLTAEICRIVETLLSDESGDLALFTQLLDEFDVFVAAQLRAADVQLDQAAQALENAENRTLQFARITSMIAQALTQVKIDDVLHDFLLNAWARVVERTSRAGLHTALRYRQLVPDIIWSIAPKVSEHDRRELFGMIPDLLATLREGISLLAWPDTERQKILDWLVDSHRHALRAGSLPIQPPPRQYIEDIFMPFVLWLDPESQEQTAHAALRSQLGLDRQLLDEAIEEMNVELNVIDQLLLPSNEQEQQASENQLLSLDASETPIDWPEVYAQLRSGVAIEVTLDGKPSRAHLNWVGSIDTGMVITIDGLSTPSVISQKVFKRLYQAGRIRFLEDASLFERAVESLLQSADQLDLQASMAV